MANVKADTSSDEVLGSVYDELIAAAEGISLEQLTSEQAGALEKGEILLVFQDAFFVEYTTSRFGANSQMSGTNTEYLRFGYSLNGDGLVPVVLWGSELPGLVPVYTCTAPPTVFTPKDRPEFAELIKSINSGYHPVKSGRSPEPFRSPHDGELIFPPPREIDLVTSVVEAYQSRLLLRDRINEAVMQNKVMTPSGD